VSIKPPQSGCQQERTAGRLALTRPLLRGTHERAETTPRRALGPRGRRHRPHRRAPLIINMSQTAMPLLFGGLGGALGMTPVFWGMGVCLVASGYFARKC
jgi:hypothetical protein